MPFIPVPNCAQVEVRFGVVSEFIWENVYYFTKTGFTQTDQTDLGNAIETAFNGSPYKTLLSNAYALRDIVITDLRSQGAPQVNVAVGTLGDKTNEVLSNKLAVVVTLRTALRGRSYRGRSYLGGWTEDNLDSGAFDTSAVNAATGWVLAIKNAGDSLGWSMCVVSRFTAGFPRAAGLTSAVTSVEVRNGLPGTQRGRSPRP